MQCFTCQLLESQTPKMTKFPLVEWKAAAWSHVWKADLPLPHALPCHLSCVHTPGGVLTNSTQSDFANHPTWPSLLFNWNVYTKAIRKKCNASLTGTIKFSSMCVQKVKRKEVNLTLSVFYLSQYIQNFISIRNPYKVKLGSLLFLVLSPHNQAMQSSPIKCSISTGA